MALHPSGRAGNRRRPIRPSSQPLSPHPLAISHRHSPHHLPHRHVNRRTNRLSTPTGGAFQGRTASALANSHVPPCPPAPDGRVQPAYQPFPVGRFSAICSLSQLHSHTASPYPCLLPAYSVIPNASPRILPAYTCIRTPVQSAAVQESSVAALQVLHARPALRSAPALRPSPGCTRFTPR